MELAINTPKGQITLLQEQYVLSQIKQKWGVDIIQTNKKREAAYDGIITKNAVIRAFFEIKCRDMSYEQMMKWGGTWLITNQKLIDGQTVSKLSTAPFLGFLYLVPDNRIFFWKITNDKGEYEFDFPVAQTKTQYCVNGGTAYRENAYLHIEHAQEL